MIDTLAKATQEHVSVDSEELIRIFNTAVLNSATDASAASLEELHEIVQSPAFASILMAIQSLQVSENVSASVAAEQIISTFRRVDTLWKNYLFKEGLQAIRDQSNFN